MEAAPSNRRSTNPKEVPACFIIGDGRVDSYVAIDLTKTRMQLHGSGSASTRVGAIGVVCEIMRQEGMMGFYKGLSPAIIKHLFYTPIRITGYKNLKRIIVRSDANNGESLSLAIKTLLGGISGKSLLAS